MLVRVLIGDWRQIQTEKRVKLLTSARLPTNIETHLVDSEAVFSAWSCFSTWS